MFPGVVESSPKGHSSVVESLPGGGVDKNPSPELRGLSKGVQEKAPTVKVSIKVPLKGGGSLSELEKNSVIVGVGFDALPEDKKLSIKVEIDPLAF